MTLHDKVYYIERVEYLRRKVWGLRRRAVAKLLETTVPKYEDWVTHRSKPSWEDMQGIMEVLERYEDRMPGDLSDFESPETRRRGKTELNLYDATRVVRLYTKSAMISVIR